MEELATIILRVVPEMTYISLTGVMVRTQYMITRLKVEISIQFVLEQG